MVELGSKGRPENSPLIANCIIEAEIGKGSTGVVYRARRYPTAQHHHLVALKYIDLSAPIYQRFPSHIERFVDELKLYHNLNNPFVIPLLDSEYKAGSHIVMIMQLVTGPTLKETLTDGPWHIWHALSLLRRVGRVLIDLHDKQITHHDVQDANVMLATPLDRQKLGLPHIYLLDFGLSRRQPDADVPFNPRPDINGLARLMQQVLWPNGDTPSPDPSRGISEAFVDVLDYAADLDTGFKSIEEFIDVLLTAQDAVADYLKREIRRLGRHGYDSEILNIIAHLGSLPHTPQTFMLPTFRESDYQTEAPTQPTKPYSPSQELEDTQAVVSISPVSAISAATPPVKPTSQRAIGRRVASLNILFIVTLLLGMGIGISQLQFSATPPVLEAPIWGIHEGYVALLHPEHRAVLTVFTEYPARVSGFSANGQYLLAERSVINLKTGRPVMTFHHAPAPQAVALSDTGKLAALHDGKTLSIWEVKTGHCLHEFTGIGLHQVADIFSPAGLEHLQAALIVSRP